MPCTTHHASRGQHELPVRRQSLQSVLAHKDGCRRTASRCPPHRLQPACMDSYPFAWATHVLGSMRLERCTLLTILNGERMKEGVLHWAAPPCSSTAVDSATTLDRAPRALVQKDQEPVIAQRRVIFRPLQPEQQVRSKSLY